MANIVAYHELKSCAHADYTSAFAHINKLPAPEIPKIGESIPLDSSGCVRYRNSFTPMQWQKLISLTVMALGILGGAAMVSSYLILDNPLILTGLAPALLITLTATGAVVYYYEKIDYDSPRARGEECHLLRSHQLGPEEIYQRYGNFDEIAAYELLGAAPASTYKEAAHLYQKQAEASRIFSENRDKIENAYERALAPSKRALYNSYSYHVARKDFIEAQETLNPLHKEAMSKLKQAYQLATCTIQQELRSLPLN